jgi:hypothetical protein
MYVIEVSLKFTPMPVSVQRKEQADADAVYNQVLGAMRSGQPAVLELTCEHQAEKKVALLSPEIAAVQVYEKSASGLAGRRPGFAAFTE